MTLSSIPPRLKGFRFALQIVAYTVSAYHQSALSASGEEDLLAERGVIVSRQTVHLWINRFGRDFAEWIRKDRSRLNDQWPMDEVLIMIAAGNSGSSTSQCHGRQALLPESGQAIWSAPRCGDGALPSNRAFHTVETRLLKCLFAEISPSF